MRNNQRTSCWAAIAAALCAVAQCVFAQDAPKILLQNRSFKLTTDVVEFTDERINVKFEVEEIYSNWQRRTLVRVRTISGEAKDESANQTPAPGAESAIANEFTSNFYADDQQVLLFGNDLRLYGYKRIASDFTNEFFHSSLLDQLPAGSPPLIGPAKFLYYAIANRQKLGPSKSDMFDIYNYEIEGKPGASYSLAYFKDPLKSHPNGVPFSLMAYAETPKHLNIVYKFKSFELLPDEPIYGPTSSWLSGHFVDASESILFDAFSLRPMTISEPLAAVDLSKSSLRSKEYRFSFKAQMRSSLVGEILPMSVGYEPSIKVLRVNKQTSKRLLELLVNYHTKRTYSIIKRVDSQPGEQIRAPDDTSKAEVSCVVSVAESPVRFDNFFSLGQMLFGSEEFVLLGMARVRGVEVRVFQAFDCTWPVWFQQPLDEGRSQEGGKLYRSQGDPDEIVLNVVVYMTYNSGGQAAAATGGVDLFAGQPLRMEISQVEKRIKRVIGRTQIDIFDFSRELGVAGADDSRLEHFFSLDDSCATEQSSHYAQLELLLQRDWPLEASQSLDWLRDSVSRNLALMRALQDKLDLASSLIYDVDTRLVRTSSRGASVDMQEIISLPATLHLMQHVHSEASLHFLGEGHALQDIPERLMFRTGQFQTCYLSAAHTKRDSLIFAYSMATNLCIIYTRAIDPKSQFDFDSGHKAIRVYQVKHSSATRHEDDDISVLVKSKNKFSKLHQRLELVNPRDSSSSSSSSLELALKSLEVRELDEERDATGDLNKFQGLGLVPVGKLSRLVEPTVENLSNEELAHFGGMLADMSAARCQATCLADLQCNSYSICVHNSRLECVISKFDFRSPHLVPKLSLLLAKKDGKLGEQFAVSVGHDGEENQASVTVKRHPACELHNKIYMDLFETNPRKLTVNLINRRLQMAADHEQCARLCVQKTQQVLREEVNLLHNISHQALSQPESQAEAITKAFRDYKYAHLNTCSEFLFFDRLNFLKLDENSRRLIEARVVGEQQPAEEEQTMGYCVLGELESKPLKVPLGMASGKRLDVEVTRATFDFTFMYDKMQDTSLVATPLGKDELKAYQRLTGRALALPKITRANYQALKELLDEGENISESSDFPLSYSQTESFCASLCFMQASKLWPACKSFDMVEIKLNDTETQTNCYFNSITLRDAIKNQKAHLITNKLKDQRRVKADVVRVVHFEPKANLIGESLDVVSLLEEDEAQLESGNVGHEVGANSFFLLCLFVLSLAVGSLLGVKLVAPKVLQGLNAPGLNDELLPEFNLGEPTMDAENKTPSIV